MHPREREWLAPRTSKTLASPEGEGFPSSPKGTIKSAERGEAYLEGCGRLLEEGERTAERKF